MVDPIPPDKRTELAISGDERSMNRFIRDIEGKLYNQGYDFTRITILPEKKIVALESWRSKPRVPTDFDADVFEASPKEVRMNAEAAQLVTQHVNSEG